MIFFHDKHWYHSEPLFSVEEEEEEEDDESQETKLETSEAASSSTSARSPSPTPSQVTITSGKPSSSVAKKQEYEFLLFNYLLRFVHREGQIGDFARAGLLFLMDVAMSPSESVNRIGGDAVAHGATDTQDTDPVTDAALALAEYIVDGDFSQVLAAGLGAVYSVLPSKLIVKPNAPANDEQGNGMVIGGTGPDTDEEKAKIELERENERAQGLDETSDPDFKARLDHFLRLLEFLQDILRRNIAHDASDNDTLDPSSLVGASIVQSILEAVRKTFLENVFYPTILECSENDGSAVAVMSYVEVMVTTLGDGQLGELLVTFLTSEDNDPLHRARARKDTMALSGAGPPQSRSAASAKSKRERRKSTAMQLLEMEVPDSTKQTEYFTSMGRFTLKDLLMSNLRSTSQPAATAALRLLQTMLAEHCHICVDRLLVVNQDPLATSFPEPSMIPHALDSLVPSAETDLSTINDEDENDDDEKFVYPGAETPFKFPSSSPEPVDVPLGPVFHQPGTTYSTHEREMGLYLALVSRVDPAHNGDAFSTGYEHYLRDALLSIQSQACFHVDLPPEARGKLKHRLNPHDPLLTLVLDALRRFFANTPEFNLALTGVLSALAFCPDRSLAGWLTFAVPNTETADIVRHEADDLSGLGDDDGDDRSVDFRIDEKLASDSGGLPAASMDDQSRPVLHSIFLGLVAQLERYRQLVDNFDTYLLERRQGLLFSENLTDALTLVLEPESVTGATHTPRHSQSSIDLTPTTPTKSPAKPTLASSAASSFVSFLTPRKKTKPSPAAPAVTTEPSTPSKKVVAASPFGAHYERTKAIEVEPFEAPAPTAGPWTPARKPLGGAGSWNPDEDDVFGGQWGESGSSKTDLSRDTNDEEDVFRNDGRGGRGAERQTVTLSRLLDNVVILEESIKELAAIIHARRSLGIDSVRYL
jgi:hypothetical protein